MNIPAEVLQLLQEQVVHEDFNNHKYLTLGDWCKYNSLDKAAALFYAQAEGEISHRNMIKEYLLDRDYMPDSYTLEDHMLQPTTLEECCYAALEAEQETTTNILDIYKKADKYGDEMTCKFLIPLINEQVEEEKMFLGAVTFITNLGLEDIDMPEWAKKQARMLLNDYLGDQVGD